MRSAPLRDTFLRCMLHRVSEDLAHHILQLTHPIAMYESDIARFVVHLVKSDTYSQFPIFSSEVSAEAVLTSITPMAMVSTRRLILALRIFSHLSAIFVEKASLNYRYISSARSDDHVRYVEASKSYPDMSAFEPLGLRHRTLQPGRRAHRHRLAVGGHGALGVRSAASQRQGSRRRPPFIGTGCSSARCDRRGCCRRFLRGEAGRRRLDNFALGVPSG